MASCGRVAPAGQGQLRRPPAHDAPSKIVQWTVVDMTFPNGQPDWQRRVDWPVDIRWTGADERAAMWRNAHGMKRSSKTT